MILSVRGQKNVRILVQPKKDGTGCYPIFPGLISISLALEMTYVDEAVSLSLGRAVFILNNISNNTMLQGDDQVEEYFGYNSILTVEGKRIRRLRRTEVSSSKLATMRYKSPQDSCSTASKALKLRDNKSSQISVPLAHSRSKLSLKCFNSFQNGLGRQTKQSVHSDYQSGPVVHKFPTQNSFANTERTSQNVKKKLGQYYLGNTSYGNKVMRLKKRSISKAQSQKQMNKAYENSVEGQNSRRQDNFEYFQSPPNLPKQKKKVQSCKPQNCHNQSQQIKQISKFDIRQSIRSKSKSKLILSKGGSRLSQSSNLYGQSTVKVNGIQSSVSMNSSKLSIDNRLDGDKNPQAFRVKQQFHSSGFNSNFQSSVEKNTLGAKSISSKLEMTQQKYQPSIHRSVHSSKIRSQLKIRNDSKIQKSQLSSKIQENSLSSSKKLKQFIEPHISRTSIDENMANIKTNIDSPPTMVKKDTFGTIPSNQIKQPSDIAFEGKKSTKSIKIKPQIVKQKSKIPEKPKHPSEYTQPEVLQNIEEHDLRLGFLYLFVDNTHKAYETNITFERYERLCFLMLKKYLFEKNRLIKTLKGDEKCLNLTGTRVPQQVVDKYKQTAQIKEKLGFLIEEGRQIFKEVEEEYHKIHRKYNKDKYIKLEAPRDNFSKQIMKLLMQELTKLYQQIHSQQIEDDQVQPSEQRIVQIIEIMFLISELNGRPVKQFQLMQEHQIDLDQYYNLHYEKIIETTEYFQKLKE